MPCQHELRQRAWSCQTSCRRSACRCSARSPAGQAAHRSLSPWPCRASVSLGPGWRHGCLPSTNLPPTRSPFLGKLAPSPGVTVCTSTPCRQEPEQGGSAALAATMIPSNDRSSGPATIAPCSHAHSGWGRPSGSWPSEGRQAYAGGPAGRSAQRGHPPLFCSISDRLWEQGGVGVRRAPLEWSAEAPLEAPSFPAKSSAVDRGVAIAASQRPVAHCSIAHTSVGAPEPTRRRAAAVGNSQDCGTRAVGTQLWCGSPGRAARDLSPAPRSQGCTRCGGCAKLGTPCLARSRPGRAP